VERGLIGTRGGRVERWWTLIKRMLNILLFDWIDSCCYADSWMYYVLDNAKLQDLAQGLEDWNFLTWVIRSLISSSRTGDGELWTAPG
jgi:hypothetical protein